LNKEQEFIRRILYSLTIPADAVLLVHSAIGKLSNQGYKVELIIKSLLEHLDKGTLLMPTMTWRTITPNNPIWDEMNTPSHTGVMTEIFRTKFATHRSLHPTHSVAGFGEQAELLLEKHHIGMTPVPMNSPYGLMRNFNSHILMIGIGLEMCTAIHHPEELIAPEIYLEPERNIEKYILIKRNGSRIEYNLRRHKKLKRNFNRFEANLNKRGMKKGQIDGVPWMIFKLDDLIEIVTLQLINNKNATLQVE